MRVTLWSPFPAVTLLGYVVVRKPDASYVVAFYVIFGCLELHFPPPKPKARNG